MEKSAVNGENMKKNWSAPTVGVKRFIPNQYISSCEYTYSGVDLWAPIQESNDEPGWQEHDLGYGIDTNGDNSDGWFLIPDGQYVLVNGRDNTFPHDSANTYFMVTLGDGVYVTGRDHKTGQPTGKTYGPGTVLYKNYNPGGYEYIEKNMS